MTDTGMGDEPVAWIVIANERSNLRIWWMDKPRAEEWSREHNLPLIPLYARPQNADAILALPVPVAGERDETIARRLAIIEHGDDVEWKSFLTRAHHFMSLWIDANEPVTPNGPLATERVSDQAVVSIRPMALSDGRCDYFVSIKVGDREVTPHVFREEYKAAYHVALYDWLLNGNGEEPDCVEFGPNDWPARALPRYRNGGDVGNCRHS